MVAFNEAFIGNVESLTAAGVGGWAVCKTDPDATVELELRLGERVLIGCAANAYREDLASVGRGDGKCAFSLDLPTYLTELCDATGGAVSLHASCGEISACMVEDVLGSGAEELTASAASRVSDALSMFLLRARLLADDDHLPDRRSGMPRHGRGKAISRLHRPAEPAPSGAGGALQLSPYVRFTMDRLRIDSVYDVDNNPWEVDEALLWYIEHYGPTRKPYRVPLSREEIAHCNELVSVPGCRHSVSRLHQFHLLRHRREVRIADTLDDDGAYRDELFEWVDVTAPALHVEDVLVPPSYVSALRTVRAHRPGSPFPLNDFFESRLRRDVGWRCFSADSSLDRGCMYLVACLEQATMTRAHQFLPEGVARALFEEVDAKGRTFVQRVADEVLDERTREELAALDLRATIGRMLLGSDFDAETGRFLSLDEKGDRRHDVSRVTTAGPEEARCDVQVIGPFGSASGLGQAARLSVIALRRAGYEPNLVNFDLDNPAPTGFSTPMAGSTPKRARVNLVHLNAEAVPFAAAYLPDVFSGSHNIGYFFWELDTPAKCHSLALEMLDEVWVSGEYGVAQYRDRIDGPVVNVGMTYETQITPSREECRGRLRDEFGIVETDTVFLATFDSFSFVQRKNPRGVIRAFKEAFPDDENVRLIIKTQNKEKVLDPVQRKIWRSIDLLIEGDPRILLVNRTFRYEDLLWFKKAADCYVSLHRSEGWGFGMIEAMTLGVPVVATGYSGNLEFCRKEHCWLVESDETCLGPNDYILVTPGQKWAEPRVADAARCLRQVHADPSGRRAKAERARAFVEREFGNEAIGARYGARLGEILEALPGDARGLAAVPRSAAA